MKKQNENIDRQSQQGDDPDQVEATSRQQHQSLGEEAGGEKQLSWREYYRMLQGMF